MRQPLLAFAFLLVGCGDVPPDNLLSSGPSSEALEAEPQGAEATLSCTLPDRPVTHGPSTSEAWELVELSTATYPKALCNDGTPGTYMIHRNTTSTKWLIWLEGGGNCYDSATCAQRWNSSGNKLMSSKQLTTRFAQGTLEFPSRGVFSVDPNENPTFHDANVVRLNYCSSDVWSGDRAADPAAADVTDVKHWHFRGRAIIQAVFRELMLHENLPAATDIVYAGGSAGAGGVHFTVDDVQAQMPAGARFMGMPDAGFRFDHPSYDPNTGLESTAVPTDQRIFIEVAAGNWGGRGDASCHAAATTSDEHTSCREPGWLTTHGHIRTPLLIIQNQYDHNPLGHLGVDVDSNMDAGETGYTERYAARTRELLASTDSLHSCFADYDSQHVTSHGPAAGTSTIDGTVLRDAIDAFYRRPCTPERRIEAPPPGAP
ncbi:pectin acetylesterase-family hydrolase [Polyangium fumosum]|nr:pectin acetylesterase-family hydrolase [Polyangium fumosum]